MKFLTTKKAVMNDPAVINGYVQVIYTGFCNLQHLLSWKSETAYTTRKDGWGADIYDFGNTVIVTGYAPFETIRADYDTTKRYDEAAREVQQNNSIPYSEMTKNLEALTKQFIREVKGK